MPRRLVAGVDSSTQQTKLVVVDSVTGELERSAARPHPDGTEVSPDHWWSAFEGVGADQATGATAVSITAQQHSTIFLDRGGVPVRDAILWNDLRAIDAADRLRGELGDQTWLDAVGLLPDAAHPVSKLRWLREHEPSRARQVSSVTLPHDWLTWKLLGAASDRMATDRSDASATGYWSVKAGAYDHALITHSLGHDVNVPEILAPHGTAGTTGSGLVVGAGCGDNAATHLGLETEFGDVVISIGTSATVSMRSRSPAHDVNGYIDSMADARAGHIPIVAMLNGARVLAATAGLLGVSLTRLDELARSAPPDAGGALCAPYLDGERNPRVPRGAGAFEGLSRSSLNPSTFARAALLGLGCAIADAVDALVAAFGEPRRVLVVGGGSRSRELRATISDLLGRPVLWPEQREHAAFGAARQAAWALTGELPSWGVPLTSAETPSDDRGWTAAVRTRYAGLTQKLATPR